jgi:phage terminase Nu1 subunit (DNA packaging protein)
MARAPLKSIRTDDVEPAPKVEFKRAGPQGKSTRVVSASVLAAMFNVSRNTILMWKRDGCPVEREAAKKGESDQYDIADVISWRIAVTESRVASALIARAPGPSGSLPDGRESKEDADARRARALADIAEVEAAEAIGAVMLTAQVEAQVVAILARASNALGNLPPALARKTAKMSDPAQIRAEAERLVRRVTKNFVWGEPLDDEGEAVDDAA